MPLKSSQGDESANMGHQAENLNIGDYSIYLTDYVSEHLTVPLQLRVKYNDPRFWQNSKQNGSILAELLAWLILLLFFLGGEGKKFSSFSHYFQIMKCVSVHINELRINFKEEKKVTIIWHRSSIYSSQANPHPLPKKTQKCVVFLHMEKRSCLPPPPHPHKGIIYVSLLLWSPGKQSFCYILGAKVI